MKKCLNQWKLRPCLPMHGCGHLLAVVPIGKISNFFSKCCRTCGHLSVLYFGHKLDFLDISDFYSDSLPFCFPSRTLSVRLLKLFVWLQRLSNLRIHSNFNCHLCLRVTEACVRANCLDYGNIHYLFCFQTCT